MILLLFLKEPASVEGEIVSDGLGGQMFLFFILRFLETIVKTK